MKFKIFFSVFILFWQIVYSQCYTPQIEFKLKSAECDDWNIYSPVDPNNTPIKYVRITFHIMQKTDSSGNFQYSPEQLNYLQNILMGFLNSKFSNTTSMNLQTTSPYIQDTRIRFSLANVYFWQSDYAWNYQQTEEFGSNLFTTYVTNQSQVAFKNNSVHIFICENNGGKGRASGIGDKSWITLSGIYASFLQNNTWSVANTLAHELGHSLGLFHTWDWIDECNDTPNNPNCWNVNEPNNGDCAIPSNNMMDYNACQCALTICQVNRMHYHLNGNGNVADCLVNSTIAQHPIVLGNELVCQQGASYTISNLQFGVGVSWSTSPGNFFTTNYGCGNIINLTPINNSITGINQINITLDYNRYLTTNDSLNLWVGRPSILELCSLTPNVYTAGIIKLPGSSCTSLIVPNGRSITFIGNEIYLDSGFQVDIGGQIEIKNQGGCD